MTKKECAKIIQEVREIFDEYIEHVGYGRIKSEPWKKYPSFSYFIYSFFRIILYTAIVASLCYGVTSVVLDMLIFNGKDVGIFNKWIFFTYNGDILGVSITIAIASAIVLFIAIVLSQLFGKGLGRSRRKELRDNYYLIKDAKKRYLIKEEELLKVMTKVNKNVYIFDNLEYRRCITGEEESIKKYLEKKEEEKKAKQKKKENELKLNPEKQVHYSPEKASYSILGRLKNSIGSYFDEIGVTDSCIVRCTSCSWNSNKGGEWVRCAKCGSTDIALSGNVCADCGSLKLVSRCPRCGSSVKSS